MLLYKQTARKMMVKLRHRQREREEGEINILTFLFFFHRLELALHNSFLRFLILDDKKM